MNDTKISVIITAYNRRNFLMQAIESVIHQEIDHSEYEVIVITNFKIELNMFSPDLQISSIVMEGTIGEFLYAGVEMSRYELIAFLDDDDTWEPNKIERILSFFNRDETLMYYHNSCSYINELDKPISYSRMIESRFKSVPVDILHFDCTHEIEKLSVALRMKGDFNLSCITIRRIVLERYIELLGKITSCQDGFFFWVSIISSGKIMIDSEKLTRYRVHDQNVTKSMSFESKAAEVGKMVRTYSLLLNYLDQFETSSKNHAPIEKWISLMKLEYEMIQLIFLLAERKKMAEMAKTLFRYNRRIKNSLKHRLLLFSCIYLVSPSIGVYIYRKISK